MVDYVKALASTMMEAHDRLYIEKATFARTIPIPTLGVGTTEFGISPDRVRALYESGRKAALDFLEPLGLRRLHRGVPARQGALAPGRDRQPFGSAAISATFAWPRSRLTPSTIRPPVALRPPRRSS